MTGPITTKELDQMIRDALTEARYWNEKAARYPRIKNNKERRDRLLRMTALLESVRNSQATADGKIAICGEYVWHVNRGETEAKREMVDLPETTGGRNIRHTYSSEAALKRAMKKAKAK